MITIKYLQLLFIMCEFSKTQPQSKQKLSTYNPAVSLDAITKGI